MSFNRLAKSGKDLIRTAEQGLVRLRTRAGEIIAGRNWDALDDDRPVIELNNWVTVIARQRGKKVPGLCRNGHNVWTNSGREFLALLMSIETPPATAFRNDRVAYIGVGMGGQPEEPGVVNLVQPVEYIVGEYLAPIDLPPTFPLTPTRTTVRYHRVFAEDEITLTPGSTVNVSELGLFTNGSPTAVPTYAPGTRVTQMASANAQAPVAYKTFEPIGKTDSLQLEVYWEIRF